MQEFSRQLLLRVIGGLCIVVGGLAWIRLAWKAISNLDSVTRQSEVGGRLMVWAISGTVLMIFGMIVLHFAEHAAERTEPGTFASPQRAPKPDTTDRQTEEG